jgi:hypothetical protein
MNNKELVHKLITHIVDSARQNEELYAHLDELVGILIHRNLPPEEELMGLLEEIWTNTEVEEVTIGWNPVTGGWNYQTGDNSFTGGAYHFPVWAIAYPGAGYQEIAGDLESEARDSVRIQNEGLELLLLNWRDETVNAFFRRILEAHIDYLQAVLEDDALVALDAALERGIFQ